MQNGPFRNAVCKRLFFNYLQNAFPKPWFAACSCLKQHEAYTRKTLKSCVIEMPLVHFHRWQIIHAASIPIDFATNAYCLCYFLRHIYRLPKINSRLHCSVFCHLFIIWELAFDGILCCAVSFCAKLMLFMLYFIEPQALWTKNLFCLKLFYRTWHLCVQTWWFCLYRCGFLTYYL